jgi:hypothetical protein
MCWSFFGYIADLSWDGTTMEKGIRIYSQTDYYHGFLLMLIFAAIAVVGSVRLRETYCRNIYAEIIK